MYSKDRFNSTFQFKAVPRPPLPRILASLLLLLAATACSSQTPGDSREETSSSDKENYLQLGAKCDPTVVMSSTTPATAAQKAKTCAGGLACYASKGAREGTCQPIGYCTDNKECGSYICNLTTHQCDTRNACDDQGKCEEGQFCRFNQCYTGEEACKYLVDCNSRGTCSPTTLQCESKVHCASLSDCRLGYHCDTDLHQCLASFCETNQECAQLGGGICNPVEGKCVAKPNCQTNKDCPVDEMCVTKDGGTTTQCVPQGEVCNTLCGGGQACTCGGAACIKDSRSATAPGATVPAEVTCADARVCANKGSCLSDKICAKDKVSKLLKCLTPNDNNQPDTKCLSDRFEPNNDSAHAKQLSLALDDDLTSCNDEDWYTFTTSKTTRAISIELNIRPQDVGNKDVTIALYDSTNPSTPLITETITKDSAKDRVSLQQEGLSGEKQFYLKVTSSPNTEPILPLHYDLSLVESSNGGFKKTCETQLETIKLKEKEGEKGVFTWSNDFTFSSENSVKYFSPACAPDLSEQDSDYVYKLDIDKLSTVRFYLTPKLGDRTDLVLSIYDSCTQARPPVGKSDDYCKDSGGEDVAEELTTSLDKGTYYVVVSNKTQPAPTNIRYNLSVTVTPPKCTTKNSCTSDKQTLLTCNSARTEQVSISCPFGCEDDKCKLANGDTCEGALEVDSNGRSDTFQPIDFNADYSPISSCGDAVGKTGGRDLVLKATVENNESFNVRFQPDKPDSKATVYFTTNCDTLKDATPSCLTTSYSTLNRDTSYPQIASYRNTSGSTQDVFAIIDYQSNGAPEPTSITYDAYIVPTVCNPNERVCYAGGRESRLCNEDGSFWRESDICDPETLCNATTHLCNPSIADYCHKDAATTADEKKSNSVIWSQGDTQKTATGNLTRAKGLFDPPGECGNIHPLTKGEKDLAYRVDLSADTVLKITVTPKSGSKLDPMVWIASTCDNSGIASGCTNGMNNTGPGEAETIYLRHTGTTSTSYWIVVEPTDFSHIDNGLFDITVESVTAGTPNQIKSCSSGNLTYTDIGGLEQTHHCQSGSCGTALAGDTNYCSSGTGESCVESQLLFPDSSDMSKTSGNVTGDRSTTPTNWSGTLPKSMGECHFNRQHSPSGSDWYYRFNLEAGQLLTVDYKDDPYASSGQQSVAFFQTTCGNSNSCFGNEGELFGSEQQDVTHTLHYFASKKETVFFVVKLAYPNTNNAFRDFQFDWKVESSKTCAPNTTICTPGTTLQDATIKRCNDEGDAYDAVAKCTYGCDNSYCRSSDPNASQSKPSNDTCENPTVIENGSSKDERYARVRIDESIYAPSIQLSDPTEVGSYYAGRDAFFKLKDLKKDQLIKLTLTTPDHNTGDEAAVYLYKESDFTCSDNIKITPLALLESKKQDYPPVAQLNYIVPTDGNYIIVVDRQYVEVPFELRGDSILDVEVKAKDQHCSEHPNTITCDTSGKIKLCDGALPKLISCGKGNSCNKPTDPFTGPLCNTETSQTCYQAKKLMGDKGTVTTDPSLYDYTYSSNDKLFNKDGFSGACIFLDSQSTSGPENYFAIDLKKGETLHAKIDVSSPFPDSPDGYVFYIMKGCTVNETCLAVDNTPNFKRELTYTADEDGTYYLVADSSGTISGVSATITWSKTAASSAPCTPFTSQCVADGSKKVLEQCTSTGALVKNSCTCEDRHCQIAEDQRGKYDLCDATDTPLVIANNGTDTHLAYSALLPLSLFNNTKQYDKQSFTKPEVIEFGKDAFFRVELKKDSVLRVYLDTPNKGDRPLVTVSSNCSFDSLLAKKELPSPKTGIKPTPLEYISPTEQTVFVSVTALQDENNYPEIRYNGPKVVYIEVDNPQCTPGTLKECSGQNLTYCSQYGAWKTESCATGCATNPLNSCAEADNTGNTCPLAVDLTNIDTSKATDKEYSFTDNTNSYDLKLNNKCTGGAAPGKDKLFRVKVPARTKLTASVIEAVLSPKQPTKDLAIYLTRDCYNPTNACITGSDQQQSATSPETIEYTNTSDTAEELYLIVDSFYDYPDATKFNLTLTYSAP